MEMEMGIGMGMGMQREMKATEKRQQHKLKGESVEVCGLLPRAGHEQETGGQRQVKG